MIYSLIRHQHSEVKGLIMLQYTHIFTIFFLLSLINCEDFQQTLIPIQIPEKTLNIIQLPKQPEQSFTYTPQPIIETQFVQVQPWVIQQNQMNQKVSMLYQFEEWRDNVDNELKLNEIDRFGFQLSESGAQKVFKWTPNLYIRPNSQFMMKINIFIIEQRKQLNYPTSQKQAHKLEIFTRTSQQNAYYFIGKAYVEKKLIITLGINKKSEYQQGESRMFRFLNSYPSKILVSVTIHATKKSGNSKLPSEMLKKSLQFSDSLSNSKMMLAQILEQVKELERDRQTNSKIKDYRLKSMDEHYQYLLTFTGIQLLVLILSSVIQMYAIRKIGLNNLREII